MKMKYVLKLWTKLDLNGRFYNHYLFHSMLPHYLQRHVYQ